MVDVERSAGEDSNVFGVVDGLSDDDAGELLYTIQRTASNVSILTYHPFASTF